MENNSDIIVEIIPLGAGQEIGRSCIVAKVFDKQIMFDFGLHMSLNDNRKYPDLDWLLKSNNKQDINELINVVLISHFHLDHCGALPLLTEKFGFKGPVVMSPPTRALLPYMLDDFRKIFSNENENQVQKDLEKQEPQQELVYQYSSSDIDHCVSKVTQIQLMETIEIEGIKIKSYYAGHVLGACMFLVEYKGVKILYTGDFNSNADRHLGAAYIDKIEPDIVITETTYCTIVRDSKRQREANFLKRVQETIELGGKVLIPVFALGRAQELSILLETYWERVGNKEPVYFSGGLIEKANFFYKIFVDWENEKIKENFLTQNLFDFKHVKPFDKNMVKSESPMVLLATPGMLHGGYSLQVFKQWCHDPKNLLIIPGYCVHGTIGNKLLQGVRKMQLFGQEIEVKMQIENMSFSAHADAKGILNLIRHCEAKQVVLVHGDKNRMVQFMPIIKEQLGINAYMPANFEKLQIIIKKKQQNQNNFYDYYDCQLNLEGEEIQGIAIKKGKDPFQIMVSQQLFEHFLKQNPDVHIEEHTFMDGQILEINKSLRDKFPENQHLHNHFISMVESVLKLHQRTQNSAPEFLNSFQLEIEENYFLFLVKNGDSKNVQKASVVFNLIQKYNSSCNQ